MKKVQNELLSISAALSSLVSKVEKIAETIETDGGVAKASKRTKAKKSPKAPAAKKAARKKKSAVKKSASVSKAQPSSADDGQTMLDNILKMISRSRNGISVERLKKRTGLESRQVSNALYKLTKKGLVETIARGVYVKKKK